METTPRSDFIHAVVDGVPVTVCRGPQMKEVSREAMGLRWCFKCRSRHEFHWIVMAADIEYDEDGQISASMYLAEPYAYALCNGCGTHDSQLFPGWVYKPEDES